VIALMYALWSFGCIVAFTLWHGVRASLGALVGIPDRPGGLYDREPRDWAHHLIRVTRLQVEAVGLERLQSDRPYVFAANHASFVDIWVLLAWLPGSVRFIAKRELFAIPLFGAALRATGQIALDRQHLDSATQSYGEAAGEVRGGRSVIVFVEGTRSRDGRLQEFKKGAFVLAIEAGVPLVPVFVRGTHRVLPRGSLWLRRGAVGLVVGQPVSTDGFTYADRDELLTRTREWFLAQQAAVDAAESQA
jgi:1-acyl-sn-glycerol-3-phosphate acyltransferase